MPFQVFLTRAFNLETYISVIFVYVVFRYSLIYCHPKDVFLFIEILFAIASQGYSAISHLFLCLQILPDKY